LIYKINFKLIENCYEKTAYIPVRDEKIINATSSRRYFFFTRAKFDANNGLFKENLVKYKGKRTSQDVVFIVFSSLICQIRVPIIENVKVKLNKI